MSIIPRLFQLNRFVTKVRRRWDCAVSCGLCDSVKPPRSPLFPYFCWSSTVLFSSCIARSIGIPLILPLNRDTYQRPKERRWQRWRERDREIGKSRRKREAERERELTTLNRRMSATENARFIFQALKSLILARCPRPSEKWIRVSPFALSHRSVFTVETTVSCNAASLRADHTWEVSWH